MNDGEGTFEADVPAAPALAAPAWPRALLAGAGSGLALLLLQGLARHLHHPLLLAPFGASCVLLFVARQSEFARTRNILLGYGIATLVGFAALWLCEGAWWTVALAVGVTIALMGLTHTVHPPAGAQPIVIVMGGAAPEALLATLLPGLALLLVAARGFHLVVHRDGRGP